MLKSITSLSRYEAASGSYQVVVDLTRKISFLPSFLQGSDTLFIGVGSDIAYVDFSQLRGVGHPGVPGPFHGVGEAAARPARAGRAERKIQAAATASPLITDAEHNTQDMLTSMLRSLGFTAVTVTFT